MVFGARRSGGRSKARSTTLTRSGLGSAYDQICARCNITPAGMNLTDILEMNFTPAEREIFGLKTGDVLLTEASGSPSQVGRSAIWHGELELCCFQNTVIRFRPHLTTPEYALVVFPALCGCRHLRGRGARCRHSALRRIALCRTQLPTASAG
jgi:hypothetical protein